MDHRDPFANKVAHLADIARANVADAADLQELSELFGAELKKRADMIGALKDLCDEIREDKRKESITAFRIGFCVGGLAASIAAFLIVFLK